MNKYLMLILTAFLFSGCFSTIDARRTMQAGVMATPEDAFSGVYKGEGMRVDMFGNTKSTFNATLKAYSENGTIYMQETLEDNTGTQRRFTYRITKSADQTGYACVDIDSVRSCSVSRAGDSIVLKSWLMSRFRDSFDVSMQSVYRILPDGKILKRSSLNRFLFFFSEEEITSYKKEL
ncbi:DUF3833 family protein [Seleniivibrio woodruffii]|uniref:Uncharacterized protein DUF3833 n=1 Tax=Seleniivibrio woodruffii TaxID=1078050 RepID=A0A4R1K9Y4_9BACT|nr:DUF3833 family protein [Seleniivibrio woodruffii]TCK59989.1 uncharacterized protein DUF3833 [Seleniivibrio woodruffii]TVZ35790.1 uncharacterized protein DUF3833 [Seleniivibrio woodruffii]